MIKFKNRYLEALIKLILISAIFHLVLLFVYSLIKLDFSYLNYFRVVDISLIFPSITEGPFSLVFSFITILIVYLIILFKFTSKSKAKS